MLFFQFTGYITSSNFIYSIVCKSIKFNLTVMSGWLEMKHTRDLNSICDVGRLRLLYGQGIGHNFATIDIKFIGFVSCMHVIYRDVLRGPFICIACLGVLGPRLSRSDIFNSWAVHNARGLAPLQPFNRYQSNRVLYLLTRHTFTNIKVAPSPQDQTHKPGPRDRESHIIMQRRC